MHILPFESVDQKGACPAYTGTKLQRTTPEKAGIQSGAINDFLKKLNSHSFVGLHSLMIARGNNIIAEAAWSPYTTSKWHVTHSMCKSITGTAIGILCDEGLLSLNEKLCDIFADKCTLLTSRRTRQLTVEHLLTMSSGISFKELGALTDFDWVKAYLESDVAFEPGTKFDYNSMNSYILSAIITRKTGMPMSEYLQTKLFSPLGFGPVLWETCPMGISKGGWGLYAFLEDFVKLGLLYMNDGVYNGKQIISKHWVSRAVSSIEMRETGEEYGYHIWVNSKNNCFIFNGMFGQYVVVFPDKNIIIALNAGNGHLFTQSFAFDTICEFCNSINSFEPLDDKASEQKILKNTIASLCISKNVYIKDEASTVSFFRKLFAKKTDVPALPLKMSEYSAQLYQFKKNTTGLLPLILQCISGSFALGLEEIELEVVANQAYLIWQEGTSKIRIPLCFTAPATGQISLNGHIWDIGTTAVFKKDEDDNDVLKISVAFLESSSTRLIKIIFYDNGITIKLDESPAIVLAMEKVQEEHVMLTKIDPTFFKDIDFVEHKFTSFCSPTLKSI